MRLVDLTGRTFERLTVLRRADGGRRVMWLCVCLCGNETTVAGCDLVSLHTKSCGCWRLEVFSRAGKKTAAANSRKGAAKAAAARTRHGHATDANRTRTYSGWEAMIQRCHNPNASTYFRYGGRGVTVCDRWRTFENFLTDMGERPEGKTLDRINPFGNYEPGNCRWATAKEQANNTRRKYVERRGQQENRG